MLALTITAASAIALVVPCIPAVPVTANAPADPSVERVIERDLPGSGVPGLAYAVVANGEIVAAGEHGVLEIGKTAAVTPDTPFLIGSISKSMTALSVMQLMEAGRLDLRAPVGTYLDGFAGHLAGAITVEQLLTHTSGFSTLQGNQAQRGQGGDTTDLERWVDELAEMSPASPPGSQWEYSNTNYQILGRLVEVISGQTFAQYVTTRILEPIGMDHSFVADGAIHEAMATGHRPWFGTKSSLADRRTDRATAPQGGISASASDLARYLIAMMNGEDDVLSAAGKAQLMRPAGGESSFYGFGWFVDDQTGAVWHGGTTPGFESLATMLPSERSAVVVLVNGGSGVGFGETAELLNGVTSTALGLDYEGEDTRWLQKALFIAIVVGPFVYGLSMLWAWVRRGKVRAKTEQGVTGLFSLWFPLLTTLVAVWVIAGLVPSLLGSPIGNLALFQPDVGLALIATAAAGVVWAAFRLVVAYTGGRSEGASHDAVSEAR